jgi:hypothetical protein
MTESAKRCDQCSKSTGNVQQTWTCYPGGDPVEAWLHRECEPAFLQRLDLRAAAQRRKAVMP